MLWFAALLMFAQSAPQQQCAAMDVNLPPPLAAWTAPGRGELGDLTKPVTVAMASPRSVTGLPAGAKPGNAAAIPFRVSAAGVYGIAVDQPVWIDVTAPGTVPLTSVSHGHGPECSTIRKIVRFDLKPGSYTIYLSGLGEANVRVMLVTGE